MAMNAELLSAGEVAKRKLVRRQMWHHFRLHILDYQVSLKDWYMESEAVGGACWVVITLGVRCLKQVDGTEI